MKRVSEIIEAIEGIGARIRTGLQQLVDGLEDRLHRSKQPPEPEARGQEEVCYESENLLSALSVMRYGSGQAESAEPAVRNLLDVQACRFPRADTGGYIGLREAGPGRGRPRWLRVIPGGRK
jgi:hypothetical protein